MGNLQLVCAEIKTAIAGAGDTPTAKLIAVLEAAGITSPAEIAALIGISERGVRKARPRNHSSGTTVPARNHSSENGTTVPEPQFRDRNHSSESGTTVPPRARVEDNNKPIYLETSVSVSESDSFANKPQREQRAVARRGTRLADEWTLPDDWRAWARVTFPHTTDAMVTDQADRFRDYWHAKPGQGGCKLDWQATWRNWCRTGLATAPVRAAATVAPWEAEKQRKQREWMELVNAMPGGAA